ncbi:MAG TPA: GtrA family protein [Ktedonobacterales bacterium]|nr:GtrA family protein [Ktedonobacterales bacterium]
MAQHPPRKNAIDYYDTQPTPAPRAVEADTAVLPKAKVVRSLPSYHPTGMAKVDRLLDLADQLTGGRAEWIQRAFSYLFVGGIAAIINLITLQVTLNLLASSPLPYKIHYGIAFVIATEVSIMANFIPNDRITFSHLPGHSRSWIQRCARFHVTCTGGVIVTFAVSSLLHLILQVPALPSQAVALIVATAFNFTFHHLFTYRHKPAAVL